MKKIFFLFTMSVLYLIAKPTEVDFNWLVSKECNQTNKYNKINGNILINWFYNASRVTNDTCDIKEIDKLLDSVEISKIKSNFMMLKLKLENNECKNKLDLIKKNNFRAWIDYLKKYKIECKTIKTKSIDESDLSTSTNNDTDDEKIEINTFSGVFYRTQNNSDEKIFVYNTPCENCNIIDTIESKIELEKLNISPDKIWGRFVYKSFNKEKVGWIKLKFIEEVIK